MWQRAEGSSLHKHTLSLVLLITDLEMVIITCPNAFLVGWPTRSHCELLMTLVLALLCWLLLELQLLVASTFNTVSVCWYRHCLLLKWQFCYSRPRDATRRHSGAMRYGRTSARVSSRWCAPRPDAAATLWYGSSTEAARLSRCDLPASCCAWRPHCGAETADYRRAWYGTPDSGGRNAVTRHGSAGTVGRSQVAPATHDMQPARHRSWGLYCDAPRCQVWLEPAVSRVTGKRIEFQENRRIRHRADDALQLLLWIQTYVVLITPFPPGGDCLTLGKLWFS